MVFDPYLVYIAGPMSGYPEHNYPAFITAENQLNALGYKTLNPVNHSNGVGTTLPYKYYIRESVWDVLNASAICVLPGWEQSTGAKLEVHLGVALGLEIYKLEDLLNQPEGRLPTRLFPRIEVGLSALLEGAWT